MRKKRHDLQQAAIFTKACTSQENSRMAIKNDRGVQQLVGGGVNKMEDGFLICNRQPIWGITDDARKGSNPKGQLI